VVVRQNSLKQGNEGQGRVQYRRKQVTAADSLLISVFLNGSHCSFPLGRTEHTDTCHCVTALHNIHHTHINTHTSIADQSLAVSLYLSFSLYSFIICFYSFSLFHYSSPGFLFTDLAFNFVPISFCDFNIDYSLLLL